MIYSSKDEAFLFVNVQSGSDIFGSEWFWHIWDGMLSCDKKLRCCAKMRAFARHPAQRGTRCCCDENLRCCAKMRTIGRHPAQRGTTWLWRKPAVRREDASTCKPYSTARHTVPGSDDNLRCSAKMRSLARHPAQRGTGCRGCEENLRWTKPKRCKHLQDIQHSAAQGAVVATKTCSAVRWCEHLQDIQHSAADSAVVVTKTCGAARRCEHLLEIETAWHTVPLLPLLAECVRTTPGPVRAEFFHKLRKFKNNNWIIAKIGENCNNNKKETGEIWKKSKIKLSKIGEKNCKNSKNWKKKIARNSEIANWCEFWIEKTNCSEEFWKSTEIAWKCENRCKCENFKREM